MYMVRYGTVRDGTVWQDSVRRRLLALMPPALMYLFLFHLFCALAAFFFFQGSIHGESLALQLMDVSLRVEEVREYAVHKSVGLLLEPSLVSVRYARDSE